MANRKTYGVNTPKSEVQLITGKLAGAGATVPTLPEASQFGGGEIQSVTRVSAGLYTLVLRHSYPHLEGVVACNVIGTSAQGTTTGMTAGLQARAILTSSSVANDGKTGLVTVLCEVGSTPTDLAPADHLHLVLAVRNSGKNQ